MTIYCHQSYTQWAKILLDFGELNIDLFPHEISDSESHGVIETCRGELLFVLETMAHVWTAARDTNSHSQSLLHLLTITVIDIEGLSSSRRNWNYLNDRIKEFWLHLVLTIFISILQPFHSHRAIKINLESAIVFKWQIKKKEFNYC